VSGPGSTASVLLSRRGAVAAEGVDAGVAAHYGDPMREQRLLAEGLAAVDLSHRGVVSVTGPDRLRWLHSMTTQHLTDLGARTSVETLVLSPKGHIEHALHLVDDGGTSWLTVEPGTAPAVVAWLMSMRFMLRVEVADRSAEYAVLGETNARESVVGEPLAWVDPWPGPVGDTAPYGPVAGHPGHDRAWRELLVPREHLADAVGDRTLAGVWAAEALRVAAWRPRLGLETDHRTIVHEVDWLRTAVHLHKGCYRGQETVARVHNLGRPPRRLVFLHLDGSGHVLPDRGTPLTLAGRSVGFMTSVVRHHVLGPIALGLIKRSTPPTEILDAAGVSAAPELIVAP
jgi:folate-binding protein YgfZ